MGLALLGAACSGGSPAASPSQNQPKTGVAAYAQCMRSHGVPRFPDPNSNGEFNVNANELGINPNSTQYRSALEACRSLQAPAGAAPAQQTQTQSAGLKFAQCMRSHGVPNFPDPTSNGGGLSGSISAQGPNGVDPNSPQFQSAQQACRSLLPGGTSSGGTPSTS
jgi:hypothetical protein